MTQSLKIPFMFLGCRLPNRLHPASLILGLLLAVISAGCGATMPTEDPIELNSITQKISTIVDVPECVIPRESWVDTYLSVNPSDKVSFRCWGDVWTGYLFSGPVQADGWGDAKDPKFPVTVSDDPEANEFGVVGSFGPGSRFQVGRVATKVVPPPSATGVWLKMNDDTPCNGSGAFHCQVDVESALACTRDSDCRDGSYCVFKSMCGGPGICTPKGVGGCPMTVELVCGCNGSTFNNSCLAHRVGVPIAHKGACP